jgi:hypothetical protein
MNGFLQRAFAAVAAFAIAAGACHGAAPAKAVPTLRIGSSLDAGPISGTGSDRWHGFGELSGGCDGGINVIERGPDGQIYLAGDFRTCDGVQTPNVARFDPAGGTFHPVGSGVSGFIRDLEWYNGDLLICGFLLRNGPNAVLRFTGEGWAPLAPGIAGQFSSSDVRTMEVVDGDLVVGGAFQSAGGVPANRVARWNGTTWAAYASGLGTASGSSHSVEDLAVMDGVLVAAGRFGVGSVGASVARWDGAQWQAMGNLPGIVNNLLVDGDELIAAGGIYDFASKTFQVRRWNGTEWTRMGDDPSIGFDQAVEAVVEHEGTILVAGDFSLYGGAPANGLAQWTGSTWTAFPGLDAMPSGSAWALLSDQSSLYVSANFLDSRGRGLHHVARWTQGEWRRMGEREGHGIGAHVNRLVSREGRILAAGSFERIGDRSAPGIAEWDGLGWQRLGEAGVTRGASVSVLDLIDGVVYAGGNFLLAGQPVASGIAQWRGDEWLPLGEPGAEGVAGFVTAIAEFQGEVVVGGNFSAAGGLPIQSIARWDGQRWAPLRDAQGGGLPNFAVVHSMTVWNDRLIVGGSFVSVAGSPAPGLAAWDGVQWSLLPPGFEGFMVELLAVWNDDLFVGGPFATLSRLSGNSWETLLDSSDDGVFSLAGLGDALYIGGEFTNLAGSGVNQLARWRGGQFEPVAGGVSDDPDFGPSVNSMAVVGGDLLVAGRFRFAGDVRTSRIAWLQPHVIDGIDLYARHVLTAPSATHTGAEPVHYQLDLGNRGRGRAPGVALSVQADPAPAEIRWSCVPLAMSVATCPADQGTGAPDFIVDLPPGSALRVMVEVEPQPETVFQRLHVDLSGQPVPGATSNNPTAVLSLVTPVQGQALFSNGFESHQ